MGATSERKIGIGKVEQGGRNSGVVVALAFVALLAAAPFLEGCIPDNGKKTPGPTPTRTIIPILGGADWVTRGLLQQTDPATGRVVPCPDLHSLQAAGFGTDEKGCAGDVCCGYPPDQ